MNDQQADSAQLVLHLDSDVTDPFATPDEQFVRDHQGTWGRPVSAP